MTKHLIKVAVAELMTTMTMMADDHLLNLFIHLSATFGVRVEKVLSLSECISY